MGIISKQIASAVVQKLGLPWHHGHPLDGGGVVALLNRVLGPHLCHQSGLMYSQIRCVFQCRKALF